MREADLFSPLKRHFESQGWAVYAEVPAPHGGYVDLLAVREQIWLAVELKPYFSRNAVRQAGRNKRFVWESYVAVPASARMTPRRQAALKRHGAGLLAVADSGVSTAIEARCAAPPCTLHEAFGRHLSGQLAQLYAAACGGVPTLERISANQLLIEKIEAALLARGGIANTEEIFGETLPWNYCRNQRAGLLWILKDRFQAVAADLWCVARPKRRPQTFVLRAESLVRTHLPDTFIVAPAPEFVPRPGDWLRLGPRARKRVIAAQRHPIVKSPQRDLRAGPAVFFRWRVPGGIPLSCEALVLRIA